MEKAEFDAIFQKTGNPDFDSGPIEDHLAALTLEDELSAVALATCLARIEEAGPPLIALLERAGGGEYLPDADATLLFRGLHVLGGARYKPAYLPVLRFLALPENRIEFLLGDAVTETLPKIIIGVFGGDHLPLFGLIADLSAYSRVRGAALLAAAYHTWEGHIPRETTQKFLQRFHDEAMAEDGEWLWYDWQQSIALLGMREFAPLVVAARASGRIADDIDYPEDFEKMLTRAEQEPAEAARFTEEGACYIEDVMDELQWSIRRAEPDEGEEPENAPPGLLWPNGKYMPAINPMRHVGRNDPCPCGSGKKYKKCCIEG